MQFAEVLSLMEAGDPNAPKKQETVSESKRKNKKQKKKRIIGREKGVLIISGEPLDQE